jgi:uncharacterized DUF497 family protein
VVVVDASRVSGFEWDEGNRDKSWRNHKVDDKEAEQVFFNNPLLVNLDEKHSFSEMRFQALGRSDEGRRLFVAFAKRGGKIRVISARDQNRKERRYYEKIKTNAKI